MKPSDKESFSKDKSSYDDDAITKSMNEAYDHMYSEYIRVDERCKKMQV